jgi:hypothetical protein
MDSWRDVPGFVHDFVRFGRRAYSIFVGYSVIFRRPEAKIHGHRYTSKHVAALRFTLVLSGPSSSSSGTRSVVEPALYDCHRCTHSSEQTQRSEGTVRQLRQDIIAEVNRKQVASACAKYQHT